jgi:hypothetical protein
MSHPNLHQQDIANSGAIGRSGKKNEPSTGHTEQGNRTWTFTDSSRKRHKQPVKPLSTHMLDMVNNGTGNEKSFSYMKSRRCESNGVSP